MEKSQIVCALIKSCHQLQQKLSTLDSKHELNRYLTTNKSLAEWELLTDEFYKRYASTNKTWRKLSSSEVNLAWLNFYSEIACAVTIANSKHCHLS